MVFAPHFPPREINEDLRVESWDEVLDNVLASDFCDAPGAVLLADTPQGRFLKAQGLASTEDGTPVTVDDAFEIGSNTKSFTTVLALRLQEEGFWSLDDLLQTYLPEQAAKIPYGDQITLHQLAQNNSGIPDYADILIGEAMLNDNLEQGWAPEEIVDYVVQNLKPSFEPGQGWEYSTTNFILLGMAAEAVTGQSMSELYQSYIFDPLEMTHSYLLEGVKEEGQTVQGYVTLPDGSIKNVTIWNGSLAWAGGGNISTAEDMAKYVAGISSDAIFQDPQSLEQLLDFGNGVVAAFSGGYGLGVGRWSIDPYAWGHGGQTPGFETFFAVFPDQDARVILLTNSGSCDVAGAAFPIIIASPDLFTQELP
jgi:D-alanyl-D-alanine carboxypeptidase